MIDKTRSSNPGKPLRKHDGSLPKTYKEVVALLDSLEINKSYRIVDIVASIKSVLNFKARTYQWLNEAIDDFSQNQAYDYDANESEHLEDLWVDMTYQRRIRLNHLMKKIKKQKGYLRAVAGFVDVAVRSRSGKKFVWDGLRRCIMVGLLGGECIGTTSYVHPALKTDKECREQEAVYFEIRNAEGEAMSAEEVFKAQVAARNPVAIELLEVMKTCGVDVESLNPDGVNMGGFVQFKKAYNDDFYTEESLVTASEIMQEVYPDVSLSGYLLTGLSYLLVHNDKLNGSGYNETDSDDSVLAQMKEYVKKDAKNELQAFLTKKRLNGKAQECIAWNIATHVLKDDGDLVEIISSKIDVDEMKNYTKNAVQFEG